jgi:branched-chain amino acid aminotransferase
MSDPSPARYAYLDGEIVPWDEARVHVASLGFRYGAGVFEGLRGYWNPEQEQIYLFRLDDHMRRLAFSQAFMRFDPIVDTPDVAAGMIELIRANGFRETVHVLATVFISGPGAPTTCGPTGVAITAATGGGGGEALVRSGCSAQVSSWTRLADQAQPMRVKCNANYHNGRLAGLQAETDGYQSALMMNARGKLAEGPGMCFFMIRDGRAVTPAVTSDILESITRDTVIGLLRERCGLEVVEREVDRSEVVSAEEAFWCGTAWEVTPITSIDRLPVGAGEVGPVVRSLQQAYFDLVHGRVDDRPQWRTEVYR